MEIHFSDEEDYNSDIESDSLWDEEDIKKGANSSSINKNLTQQSKEEEEENKDDDNKDEEEDKEIEEGDGDGDGEDDDEDEEVDGKEEEEEDGDEEEEAEDEYYPEEDAGEMEEIIVKEEDRITSDVLSKYEMVELISIRATQISKGDKPFTGVGSLRDPISMAKKELYDNRCPLLVKRNIGNNMYEYWNPNHMSKPKI